MDISEVLKPDQFDRLHHLTVKELPNGVALGAQYPATRRSGRVATRYMELRIESWSNGKPRWRWRSGYLYNDMAAFWPVAPAQQELWDTFARYVATTVREEARQLQKTTDKALSLVMG